VETPQRKDNLVVNKIKTVLKGAWVVAVNLALGATGGGVGGPYLPRDKTEEDGEPIPADDDEVPEHFDR
jgi:hypothetical protein